MSFESAVYSTVNKSSFESGRNGNWVTVKEIKSKLETPHLKRKLISVLNNLAMNGGIEKDYRTGMFRSISYSDNNIVRESPLKTVGVYSTSEIINGSLPEEDNGYCPDTVDPKLFNKFGNHI
jgi:hypothetical protein